MRDASGRSKGCGIVEYRTAMEAQTAINTLLDTELKGRLIFVREDREAAGPSVPIPVRLAYRSTGFCSFFPGEPRFCYIVPFFATSYFLPGNSTSFLRMYANCYASLVLLRRLCISSIDSRGFRLCHPEHYRTWGEIEGV